jgi:hypothetical protein
MEGKSMIEWNTREEEEFWRAVVINYLTEKGPTCEQVMIVDLTTAQPPCPPALKQCQLAGTLLDLLLEKKIVFEGERDNYTVSLPAVATTEPAAT